MFCARDFALAGEREIVFHALAGKKLFVQRDNFAVTGESEIIFFAFAGDREIICLRARDFALAGGRNIVFSRACRLVRNSFVPRSDDLCCIIDTQAKTYKHSDIQACWAYLSNQGEAALFLS